MKLKDKIAVITGGASGIGKAIAERYTQEGARVVVADLDEKMAGELTGRLGNGSFALRFDVTKQESIDNLVTMAVERAGRIDILVNNAGIFAMAPIVEVSREQWHKLFSVNSEGLFFTMQAVAKQMIKQGSGGKIINLASQAGRRGESLVSIYCPSKGVVIAGLKPGGRDLEK